ncbi:MAG: DUF898 domain-containing protein, partial [Burkholderiales bacterium]|nr:DUF898 domain-containing protein [Burkholderiales bacterium]
MDNNTVESAELWQTVDAKLIDQTLLRSSEGQGYADSSVQPMEQQCIFTGSGQEYFRIWIINLCLTIATLGIYSAWAKVRRLQYFDRNTQLDGAVFNFHGDPVSILRGRVIAVVLLFGYDYLFGLSRVLSVTVVVALILLLPMMLRSALRFRLRNTSYRGLRFDFSGSVTGAYLTYLPVIILFLAPGIVGMLFPRKPLWVVGTVCLYLFWPFLYARIKIYQHENFSYGKLRSHCWLSVLDFFWPYFVASLFILALVILVAVFAGGVIALLSHLQPGPVKEVLSGTAWISALIYLISVVSGYTAYLICGPALQTTIWNKVWSHTYVPGVRLTCNLPLRPYLRLQAKNLILTLLTLGLYRPFAVVSAYQFRLAHSS